MLTARHLAIAVRRGIITPGQEQSLTSLMDEDPDLEILDQPVSSDETMRLVGGGNDLFVTVGVLLLLAGGYFALSGILETQYTIITACLIAFIWVIAEFVTRQRRMRLASTVLGLAFAVGSSAVLASWIDATFDFSSLTGNAFQLAAMRNEIGLAGLMGLGGIVLASVVYFWRFKVPVMAAVIAMALTTLVFYQTVLFLYDGVTTGQVAVPDADQIPAIIRDALYLPLLCGLAVFATGTWFDLYDRERQTIWSDCAFWLHVVSAPLLVHPLFILATGQDVVFGRIEPGTSAVVILTLLIALFVYVALAIDRRSLLVPTLAYFGTLGIYNLVTGVSDQTGIPAIALVLLAVGATILIFGAGWQRIRRIVIGTTLPISLLERLPPIKIESGLELRAT